MSELQAEIAPANRRGTGAQIKEISSCVLRPSSASRLYPPLLLRCCSGFGLLRVRIRAMECRAVVVNCRDVPYIDSTGMGCLVSLFITLRNTGGAFALAEASERTRSILALTKLDTVLPIYGTETQALDAVSEPAAIARMDAAAGQSH